MLDIGSNSIRFVVYDIYGSHFTPVYNEKVLAGLGRDLKTTGRLSEDGKKLALVSLARFKAIADARGLTQLLIGATAAMREADDAAEFITEIYDATGLQVTPISGKEEARLSALGLLAGDPGARGLAADLGGASLELIRIDDQRPGERISLPLGPFDVVGGNLHDADYHALIPQIDATLASLPAALSDTKTLYLIGGAWRNLASIHMTRSFYPLKTMQNYALDPLDGALLTRWAYNEGRSALFDWPGMRSRRAETLPYSGLLLERLIRVVKPRRIEISLTGLREGLVFDHLPKAIQGRDALLDGCRDFASGSLQSELFGPPLMTFIEAIADALPNAFGPEKDHRLRQAACLLAGLGKNLHPDYRAELIFENVLYAPISGLSHPQRVWLALTLFRSVSRNRKPPNREAVDQLLTADQISVAESLGSAIRLAIVATGRTPDLVDALTLSHDATHVHLRSDVPELMTEQVEFRLRKLSERLGLRYSLGSEAVSGSDADRG
ncbi:exopolyphosphatase [Algimonas arctica]|uniref:Exopolyphosphatase n=1 Tax=Algimonas arctica TaxID=1479486 RepID=A0A8J3CSK0_9PROT|nr:Ppx/GppA phosphatase family protein [Algimonas arctica]GHB03700.1 exopolyphosphatase [Algimonas arctica]